jgi:hypothetical protein
MEICEEIIGRRNIIMNLWRECMEIRITTCGISFLTKALNPCNPGEVNCAMPENEANVEYSQL